MTPIGFYRAFEDEYRGSRELIQSRLQVYLPFVAQLQQLRPQLHALDLGCGRGEWLQLLHQQGVQCQGVDQDPDMLAACEQRQLPAVQGDAIAFLRSQPEQSQDIVSAFHLVEHLPFEALQELVGQAHRVLKEGGLLIMETPNPENLYVGSSNFHLDPSHNKPLPPLLLSFLPQHQGFERSRILRLQGKQTDWSEREIGLQNVLFDVSPDYAVVAQKGGAQQPLSQFDRLFEEEHGIGLHEMALRYDDGVKRRRQEYEGKIWNLAYRLEQLEKRASEPRAEQVGPTVEGAQREPLQAQLEHERAQLEQAQRQRRVAEQRMQEGQGQQEELRQRLEQVQGQLEGERQQGREREEQVRRRVRELEEQSRALRQSWSWRITSPLRLTLDCIWWPFLRVMRKVLGNPALSRAINQMVLRYPGLHRRLRTVAVQKGFMSAVPEHGRAGQHVPYAGTVSNGLQTQPLTPRAQVFHEKLQRAIQYQKSIHS